MENNEKILEDLQKWQKETQSVFDNLSTFVSEISKELTPEEQKLVDSEMEKLDISDLKGAMADITKQLNEEMKKFNL